MIFRIKTDAQIYREYVEKRERLATWHSWFAWKPISGDGWIVWLRNIERRRKGSFDWEYRLKEADRNDEDRKQIADKEYKERIAAEVAAWRNE